MGRVLYEVRVREQVGSYKWQKKSKFYEANSSGEATSLYRGSGKVMWCEKVGKEKLLGIGEFFKLGDRLLKEFAQPQVTLSQQEHTKEKDKRRGRLFYKKKQEAGDY